MNNPKIIMLDEDCRKLIRKYLADSYTKKGMEDWFGRTRYQLDGLSPEEALGKGFQAEVLKLAYDSIFACGT